MKKKENKNRSLQEFILANINDTVFLTETDGSFLYVCPNVDIIFGCTYREVEQLGNITKLIGENAFPVDELRRNGELLNVKWTISNEYAVHRTVLAHIRLIRYEGKETILFTLRDITHYRQLEEDLRAYQRIVSSTNDFISLLDKAYRYRIVNGAYSRRNLRPVDQILGRTVAEILGDDVFHQVIKDKLDRCLNGETVRYQEWFDFAGDNPRFLDMTYTPYIVNDAINGIVVNGRDITDIRSKEKLLDETQRLSKVGGWEWDVETQSTSWTEEAYRIHGLEPNVDIAEGDVYFGVCLACCDPGDRTRIESAFRRCIRKGIPYDMVLSFTKCTGERIWIRTIGNPVRDGGRVVKIAGYIMDVTDRKREEIALKDSLKELETRAEVAKRFLTSPQEQLFSDILALLRREFDSQHGYIGYLDQEGNLVCPSLVQDIWRQCRISENGWFFPKDHWERIWGESLIRQTPVLRNESLNLPEGHIPLQNALAVPLMAGQQLIGQIVLANKPHGYQPKDLERLESLAEFIAPVLKIYLDKETAQRALEFHVDKLEERNIAMKVLLENQNEEKQKLSDMLQRNFEKLVFPYYEKLAGCQDKEDIQTLSEIVASNTQACLSQFQKPTTMSYRLLTPMEIQVADLIKAGKTSKEIAALIGISERTVYFHRNNLRKKLNLQNTKTNLRTLLSSLP